MKTFDILLKAVTNATKYSQVDRLDNAIAMASQHNRITEEEKKTILWALADNSDIDADYWRLVDEAEVNRLKSTGMVY